MPDFDAKNPPAAITNPAGGAGAAFPRHLHRFVPEKTETSMVVGWHGKEPIHNEYVSVTSEEEQADALAQGYALAPVLKAPDEKKPAKAAKGQDQ